MPPSKPEDWALGAPTSPRSDVLSWGPWRVPGILPSYWWIKQEYFWSATWSSILHLWHNYHDRADHVCWSTLERIQFHIYHFQQHPSFESEKETSTFNMPIKMDWSTLTVFGEKANMKGMLFSHNKSLFSKLQKF